jgi:hypothetical protein
MTWLKSYQANDAAGSLLLRCHRGVFFFFFSVSFGVSMTITSQVLRWEEEDLFFFCVFQEFYPEL